MTYPLQAPVWDVQAMEIFQPLRHVKQLWIVSQETEQ